MQRVLVIGPCGAGKSTLARRLGVKLGLPVIHIDQLNWKPGWIASDTRALSESVLAATQGERWVIDGNYGTTMPVRLIRADTVVYLDFPIRLCLSRILRRWWTYRGRTRPDMTRDCPERLDLGFLWYALRWKRGPGNATEAELAGYNGAVIRLENPRAVELWLSSLG